MIQLCIYMYLSFLKFFPHLGYYRILSSVPCTMLMSHVICCLGFICHLHPFCCLVAKSCPALHNPMDCSTLSSLSLTISRSLLKFTSIESVMPSNHLILCCPLLILPSIFPSIRVFSNESILRIRWPEYWSFSLGISPSKEYSRLISLRIDWFDLLAVQGILKSLLQTPQFERISSLALSLLYGPILTSIHDYWKVYSLHCMNLCQQCLYFLTHCLGLS